MPGELSRVDVLSMPPITFPNGATVAVSNFPATQPVSGTVTANINGTVPVSGTFWQATQPISGTVSVGNFPATQAVSGAVSVSNFPATQAVSVSNFPTSQAVTGTFWQATQPVSGTVSVGNFPATTTTISRGTGSMATGQIAMSAGNTAYQVAPARATRRSITFVPTSQFTYFYGNSGVTTTTGAAAPNGAAITLETTAAVFVVSGSTGTMTFVEHF